MDFDEPLPPDVLAGFEGADELAERATAAIREAEQVYVSSVSGWEIETKASLERLETARELPWHHRDPFDRMLIAQARSEGLTLVSCDRALRRYDVKFLRA